MFKYIIANEMKKRNSKLNRKERRINNKKSKEEKYMKNALHKHKKDDHIKILENNNIYIREDGMLFCTLCIKEHGCGLFCWCCVDVLYEYYNDIIDHMKNIHVNSIIR
jgi:hypothetical protein